MNVTLYPTEYSKDNSRLHAILLNKFKGKRTPILYGYFSFVKEQFYISNTAPGVRLTYEGFNGIIPITWMLKLIEIG